MKYDYIDLCDVPATLHGFYGCILILKCVHRICCIFVQAAYGLYNLDHLPTFETS